MPRLTLTVENLAALPVTQRLTVPADYLDIMGHMNIRWYFAIFSDAARDFTAAMGITEAYVAEQKAGAFMLRHHNQYFAEVRAGHSVAVRTRLLGYSQKHLHYINFMVNESRAEVAATMEIITAHADLTARRTAPFPPHIAETLAETLAAHRRLAWDAPVCGVFQP